MRRLFASIAASALIAASVTAITARGDGLYVPAPSWSYSISSLGTGVATALGINVGTTGAVLVKGTSPSTDLSDATAPTSWLVTDASGADLSFSSVTGNYTKINRTCVGNFRMTFPSTADPTAVSLNLPCTLTNNGNATLGICLTTAAGNNGTLVLHAVANTSVGAFVTIAGGAAAPSNANLSTAIVSCQFAFATAS